MSRVDVRDQDAGQLIGDPSRHRADPRCAQPPQEQVRQKTGEDVVQDERDVHRLVRRHHLAQKRRGIQHVAVRHDVDVRQASHDHRIPEREVPGPVILVRGPLLDRVAARVLIAVRRSQPLAGEHRQGEDRDEERHDTERGEMRATGRVGNRGGRSGGGHVWVTVKWRRLVLTGPPAGLGQSGRAIRRAARVRCARSAPRQRESRRRHRPAPASER